MNLKKLKKALVLMLSCAVVTGGTLGVYAANDDEGSNQTITEETTDATDETTDAADETTDATDETTDATDETTGTDETTEVTDETTDATDETTDATDETTEVTDETTDATDETTDATDEATDETTEVTDETTDATDETTEVTDETTDATDETTDATDETTEVTDETTDATDETTDATDETTEATDETTDAADEATDETTDATDETTDATDETTGTDETTDTEDEVIGSIEDAAIEMSFITCTYDGTEQKPVPTVTLSGVVLTEGTDYTVSYSGNVNVGTATVTIQGIGSYTGTVTRNFTITAAALNSVTLEATVYICDGTQHKPAVTVKNAAGNVLTEGTDYNVTYTYPKRVGTAIVTVTGIGNYAGSTITKNYKIKPDQVVLNRAESVSSKKFTVAWTKLSGNVKYQIAYKVKGTSTFSYKTVSKSKVEKTISGLKSGKVYKVKVRAIKTRDGVTYNGAWSNAMFITVR